MSVHPIGPIGHISASDRSGLRRPDRSVELEIRPAATLLEILPKALGGASPLMAPGILALAAMLALAATYDRMDPENPVVKLCGQGMRAESEGRMGEARIFFDQAWNSAQDDFEACIAAHYVARHQPSAEDTLYWNQVALARAEAVGDERVVGFYPSLFLNLGHSFEMLGDLVEAQRYYDLAAERVKALPEGSYGTKVRMGISAALNRIHSSVEGHN